MATCPCCGCELPLGLFEEAPAVMVPAVFELLAQNDSGNLPMPTGRSEGLTAFGRYFVPCRLPLPLHWEHTPVACSVWAELRPDQFEQFQLFRRGERRAFQALASLACEVPGFPGTIGSPILLDGDSPAELVRVVSCSDERIRSLGRNRFDHDQLVMLYRRMWGGKEEVVDADESLRLGTLAALRRLAKTDIYVTAVVPPPSLAGIAPAGLVTRPPFDTGAEALLATLGNAEAVAQGHPYEVLTWARNPGEPFIRSFSEFCYWSRKSSTPLERGQVIAERAGVPTAEAMSAWLICQPWWLKSEPHVVVQGREIDFLAAVPISGAEEQLARRHGADELVSFLDRSGVDVADLHRASAL